MRTALRPHTGREENLTWRWTLSGALRLRQPRVLV